MQPFNKEKNVYVQKNNKTFISSFRQSSETESNLLLNVDSPDPVRTTV